jgi:hypothetical protein
VGPHSYSGATLQFYNEDISLISTTQGVTLLVIMRVKEVARKKWGQPSDNPITNSQATGSSYNPPANIRASHSSSGTQISDAELDGLDTLLVTEYEVRKRRDSLLTTMHNLSSPLR